MPEKWVCFSIEPNFQNSAITAVATIKTIFKKSTFSFSGLKFRRQHWFFMGCVGVLLIFALALGISLSRGSGTSLSQSPELRDAAVAQLLAEVPLVDG
jgi:uncharacterized membrane protein YhaH (DUF805 family)